MTTLHIFPLRENKAPAVPKGTSWRDWSGDVHTAIQGVMIPAGVFVIDLDLYKGVDHGQVERAIGCALPWSAARLQRTPGSGEHYAFAAPDGVKLHQGQDIGGLLGFDSRAAGDGYIATGEGYTPLHPCGVTIALANPSMLPTLPPAAVEFFSRSHSRAATVPAPAGLPVVAQGFQQFLAAQPLGLSLDEIEAHLAALPDDAARGDAWLRVGMAVWHETQGSDDGWCLFDEFSQRAGDVYDYNKNWARWCSWGNAGGKDPITFATVIHMARPEVELPPVEQVMESVWQLKARIEAALYAKLKDVEVPEFGRITHASIFEVCPRRLQAIATGCYWQPVGAKGVWLLNHSEYLNFHAQQTAHEFITERFGVVFNRELVELAARVAHAADPSLGSTVERYIREVMSIAPTAIMKYLEFENQRHAVGYSVDMFADSSVMQLEENSVRIVYQHRPLAARVDVEFDRRIVDDYLQHFGRFHELMEFICAARFAVDRKKAYLWIHAGSDWGKGFLMSVFGAANLDISVDLSMTEIEKMFEGAPVGRGAHEFRRAMILNFNEVKGIKRELKEIESTLRLAPKHQMMSTVDVYAKLLWSADGIGSLVSEEGVEDQLANRISVFREVDCAVGIGERPLYQEVGGRTYHAVICQYAAQYMNARIEQYRALGRDGSSKQAQQYLEAFHDAYGIGKLYGVTSEALPAMADDLLADIHAVPFQDRFEMGIVEHPAGSGRLYLAAPRRFVSEWIKGRYSRSELGTLAAKMPDLVALISADGRGRTVGTWVNGKSRKLLALRD